MIEIREPLTPFLFLLVAEGLRALIKKMVNLEFFKDFQTSNSKKEISHLQYCDDTLLYVRHV
jgi:hypothetical protein